MKVLLVEDNAHDRQVCEDTVKVYNQKYANPVELVVAKDLNEARERLDKSIDAAVVDLKLGADGSEGNEVIRWVLDAHYRIPVAILTGTPDAAELPYNFLGVFKKGDKEASYEQILVMFSEIHSTGITNILGGKGIIEQSLDQVFRDNLLPMLDKWKAYGKDDSVRAEKGLLRYTLSHLVHLLEEDDEKCFPEEMYITPPPTENVVTGSVVTQLNAEEARLIVLNPSCDLVIRHDGSPKTDSVLLVEIDQYPDVVPDYVAGIDSKSKAGKVRSAFANKANQHHHWLPSVGEFQGGFVNFRKVRSVPFDEFTKNFSLDRVRVAAPFVKDILARFSAYYSRQGQPDIDLAAYIPEKF